MSSALADSLVERYLEPCLSCLSPRKKTFDDELGGRSGKYLIKRCQWHWMLKLHQGVQREMKIAHNQPHLVPPMKLVFYDDMPSTPRPGDRASSRVSVWAGSNRDSSNRASRATTSSLMKRRRTAASTKGAIPRPDPPIRRLEPFRPLELSIYLPNNRLSDLPEFNVLDFTADGEIQMPPKALVRAKSEAVITRTPSPTSPRKAYQSMIDDRSFQYWRSGSPGPQTVRNQRENEQLPAQRSSVVWNGLPGLPASTQTEIPPSNTMHTPPKTPPNQVVAEHLSMTLTFPPVEREDPPVPAIPVRPPRLSSLNAPITPPATPPPASRLGTPNGRVSQWLQRTPTSSTVASRRSHRSPSKLSISAPMPISDRTPTMSSIAESNTHSRTRTTSSSTVASTALSSILMDAASVSTYTTMNTAPVPPMPKKSLSISDDAQVTPRQNQMKTARKGSESSHWNYLPAQYAEVWKRETIVSEADVGMAF